MDRVVDEPFVHQVLGQPEVAGVEDLDLGAHTQLLHLAGHLVEHRRAVDHDVVALSKVHGPAVQRGDLGHQLAHVGQTLGGPGHVGALVGRGQGFTSAEPRVRSPPMPEVRLSTTSVLDARTPLHHLGVQLHVAGRLAGFGIADVDVDDGRTGVSGVYGRFGYLLRA